MQLFSKDRPGSGMYYLTLLIAAMCLTSGCEEAFIDPFNNDGKYFTVYGFLDESKNFQVGATQDFRVIAVTRNAENITSPSAPQADLDGRVFLTDLNLDQTRELTHQLVEIQPGEYGHIFSARIFIQPGRRYRLEIVRKDGITTSAETTIPNTSGIRVEPSDPLMSGSDVLQDIMLEGVGNVWSAEMVYHISGGGCFNSTRYNIPYGRKGVVTDQGWALTANISNDLAQIRDQTQSSNLTVCAMGIRAKVMDDQWSLPDGEINIEEISLPDELTNVENGYGFFGSAGLFQSDWQLNAALDALIN